MNGEIRWATCVVVCCTLGMAACERVSRSEEQADILARLKLSQACAESADKFLMRQSNDSFAGNPYTSHFNAKMGRCLIKVEAGGLTNPSQMIYDAIDGTELGWAAVGGSNGVTVFRFDQQRFGEDAPRQQGINSEFAQWFRALMTE